MFKVPGDNSIYEQLATYQPGFHSDRSVTGLSPGIASLMTNPALLTSSYSFTFTKKEMTSSSVTKERGEERRADCLWLIYWV